MRRDARSVAKTSMYGLVSAATWIVASGLACGSAHAQASFDARTRAFRLDADGVTYAFGVTEAGLLQATYWGPRLSADDTLIARTPARVSSIDPTSSVSPQEFRAGAAAFIPSRP